MGRGGSRVNSGPAPDPSAFRRERPQDQSLWRTLPSGVRAGAAPKWPLQSDRSRLVLISLAESAALELQEQLDAADTAKKRAALRKRLSAAKRHLAILQAQTAQQDRAEKDLWRDLWTTPQSAVWLELGWTRDVAQYVRHKVLAEMGSIDNAKEARQWSDRLGLNPSAMLRNRWRVSVDEIAPRRSERAAKKAAATRRSSSRSRLKVVPNAGTE